jgi:hypothetical protein
MRRCPPPKPAPARHSNSRVKGQSTSCAAQSMMCAVGILEALISIRIAVHVSLKSEDHLTGPFGA